MSDTQSTSTGDIQESQAQQLHKIFPQRLSDNYKRIQNLLRPIRSTTHNKNVSAKNSDVSALHQVSKAVIDELEYLLNDSMPQSEYEHRQRVQEYLHFHRDPSGYYQHLNDSKLRFLVLWTDYKAITNHFRIRNVIHVRWTGNHYECQLFDRSKRIKQAARQNDAEISRVGNQHKSSEYDLTESSAVLNATT